MIKSFLETALARGYFTDKEKEIFERTGFFVHLDDDEYTDLVASHTFKDEVPGESDFMTFDLQLTIDWMDKDYWFSLGVNEGDGFDCAASIHSEDIENDEGLLKWLDNVPTMMPQEDNKHEHARLLQHIKDYESAFVDFKRLYLSELLVMAESP